MQFAWVTRVRGNEPAVSTLLGGYQLPAEHEQLERKLDALVDELQGYGYTVTVVYSDTPWQVDCKVTATL